MKKRGEPIGRYIKARKFTNGEKMQSLNVWSWLVIIAISLAMLYPYIRIIRRTGHSGWWFLTMFVPVVNVIMLWVFAFVKWPAVDHAHR